MSLPIDDDLVNAVVEDNFSHVMGRLSRGASTSVQDSQGFPLNCRLQNASPKLLGLLVGHGMKLNGLSVLAKDVWYEEPIDLMIQQADFEPEALTRLVDAGVKPVARGMFLLIAIAKLNDAERALRLAKTAVAKLRLKTNASATDKKFMMPIAFMAAVRRNNFELADAILEAGAEVSIEYMGNVKTVEGAEYVFKRFGLSFGSKLPGGQSLGVFMLFHAVYRGRYSFVHYLVANGVDPDEVFEPLIAGEKSDTARNAAKRLPASNLLLRALDGARRGH